jgi:hypothetical protein
VSTAEKPRRPYAGTGIPELHGPRSRVVLPSPEESTLLPDPRVAHANLLARFRAANGPTDAPHAFPYLSARDVRALANAITFALRNDLPAVEAHDAAVLWDKWRQAVDDVRRFLKPVRDEAATNASSDAVWAACIQLDHRGWDLIENLVTALGRPGDVFARYCPWRADWATHERVYPGAA